MGGGVSPLSAAVLDVGFPQQGKSRLTAYISSIVAVADTYIAQLAQEKLNKAREDGQTDLPAALTVDSIGMQSVTLPEIFYRCSPDWPQTEEAQMLHHRDIPSRACRSMILNMDEGYEFLGALSVNAGGAAAGSKDTGPCAYASTLNTLLGTGKLQRSTRSSGSYGSSNSAIVKLDLLENLHPEMLIKIERGLVGNHVQATKERFLFSAGRACKRHDALPDGFRLPAGVNSRWTRVWPRALAGTSITSPHTPPRMTSNHTHCKRTTFPTSRKATTWALQVATSPVLGTGSRCAFRRARKDRVSDLCNNSNKKCCPTSRSTSLLRYHSRNLPVCSFSASSLSKAFSPRMQTKRATAPRRLSVAQRPARSAQGPQDARLCGEPPTHAIPIEVPVDDVELASRIIRISLLFLAALMPEPQEQAPGLSHALSLHVPVLGDCDTGRFAVPYATQGHEDDASNNKRSEASADLLRRRVT